MTEIGFSACIFDMDGTLIDSMPYWLSLPEELLGARGLSLNGEDKRAIWSMSIPEALVFIKERFSLEESLEKLNGELKAYIDTIYSQRVGLKDGVKDYLEELKKKDIPMCVATASDRECAERVLERLGVRQYFSFIITDGEVGKSKHEPDIYLICAEKMGVSPSKTAVFEDSFSYARAARSAGFQIYAVEDVTNKKEYGEFCDFADGRARWQDEDR